jgi:dolichyl-diphosphooligosaccharide--protein glycosyltransferase
LVLSTIYGIILFGLIWHISDNILFSYQAGGMEVSQNWRDALNWLKANSDENTLITTWWDPGHIITGYTGLKVMADGAHCGDACYPYNHNIRIQDMGRVFSISNETEAISILQKYIGLTPQQCQELKQKFGDAVPANACNKISKMYVIASSDLIGKYYWLSYFGTGTGRNFVQLPLSGRDASGNLVYGNILTLAIKENQLVPIINIPQQGIINAVVKEIIFYQNGQERRFAYTNVTNAIDGLVWVDPSFQIVIFMDSQIRDSIFTKMFFFDGKDLTHFTKVFENPEVKIYKVIF